MFLYGALDAAQSVYAAMDDHESAYKCEKKAAELKRAINAQLYDASRNLYFEGLNTPTPDSLIGKYMPQNVDKRYFRAHANILAAYFGICPKNDAQRLISSVMDGALGEFQPYFAHFLLEAIFRAGLREKYTLALLERWKAPVRDCPKGLVEGFIPPMQGYHFDHSHAWGGSPLYSLPKALLGLAILEPGLKKIAVSPSLLGLESARVELPTPMGLITCQMERGKPARIDAPEGVDIVTE